MRVLIPIDWSENASYAFNWYLDNLHLPNWTVVLVHFIDAGNDRELQAKEIKLMQLQEHYETKLLERKVNYHWVAGNEGSAGEYIIKMSFEEEVTLIVMGCRGMGKLKKTIIKSISDHVIERSQVPVIVCKRP